MPTPSPDHRCSPSPGRPHSRNLHARGWNVVIHYRGRQQQARALADKLNQQRPESAVCYHADLTDMNQLRQLAEQPARIGGQLNALVNNASVFTQPTKMPRTGLGHDTGRNLKAPSSSFSNVCLR